MQQIPSSVLQKLLLAVLICVLLAGQASAARSDEAFVELCKNGSLQQIASAIKGGANVNVRDLYEWTPLLHAAFENSNPEVTTALLKAGADANIISEGGLIPGITPLMLAAQHNPNLEVLTAFIQAGADVNIKDAVAMTPLMAAVWRKDNPALAITILAKAGADVNAQDDRGKTALMWAARDTPNPEVITALLDFGSDPKIKDNSGKMTIDYARENVALKGTDVLKKLEKMSR